ncbi:MAG: hypothetical protein V9E83_04310 [Baekduia sp.]
MRNRQLHDALRDFAEEAAWQLASDASGGDDVPFEVVETKTRENVFYCYRPLTGDFIAKHQSLLGLLPTYLPALHAIGACNGLPAYLRAHGRTAVGGGAGAVEALRQFLTVVFKDSSDFVLSDERFEQAYAELEQIVMEGRVLTEVIAPLLGLRVDSARVELGGGLSLIGDDAGFEVPAEARRGASPEHPGVLIRLEWEAAAGDEAPLHHAQVRLGRLLTALRLYDASEMHLAPTAWVRTGGDRWQPFALGDGGSPRGVCVVPAHQEDELRAFLSLVGRRSPKSGELAWALGRFSRACSAQRPSESLTDALLALRALLEPEGPQSGRLPARLAALCAIAEQRATVTERVAHLAALERSVVAGVAPDDESLREPVEELVGWLRALLRDVLCGHLDSDLRAVADGIFADEDARQATLV